MLRCIVSVLDCMSYDASVVLSFYCGVSGCVCGVVVYYNNFIMYGAVYCAIGCIILCCIASGIGTCR